MHCMHYHCDRDRKIDILEFDARIISIRVQKMPVHCTVNMGGSRVSQSQDFSTEPPFNYLPCKNREIPYLSVWMMSVNLCYCSWNDMWGVSSHYEHLFRKTQMLVRPALREGVVNTVVAKKESYGGRTARGMGFGAISEKGRKCKQRSKVKIVAQKEREQRNGGHFSMDETMRAHRVVQCKPQLWGRHRGVDISASPPTVYEHLIIRNPAL